MAHADDARLRRSNNDPAEDQPSRAPEAEPRPDTLTDQEQSTPASGATPTSEATYEEPPVNAEPLPHSGEELTADAPALNDPAPESPASVDLALEAEPPVDPAPAAEPPVDPAPEAEVVASADPAPENAVPEALASEPQGVVPEVSEQRPVVGASADRVAAPAGNTPSPPRPKGGPPGKRPSGASKIVEGLVTSVTPDEVELTLDDGRTAVINRRNFGPDNQDPSDVLSPGDRAFGAELAREDPKQRVVLSRAWALKRMAWDKVIQVAGLNETLTGKVVALGAKGVVVDVGVRGFVPTSHLELETVKDLSPYLDQMLELKVLEADPRRERLVLSRRSLLLRAQRKKAQELLSNLKPGDSCHGTVTSITNYGAFVDIGGVNGLVHLSELSWRRIRRPNDIVSLGDEVDVQVLEVKAKKRRISLPIRRLIPDPLTQLQVGEIRQGPVTRLVDFGAFVALGELEGLVHLSELAEYRVSTPEEVVAPGDEVGVKILSIDKKRRRIELSIRQAAEFGG